MSARLGEYWGRGGLSVREERFRAIMEVYPIMDLKFQLQKLKEIFEEVLNENKNIMKEEAEAMRIMKQEVEALLSKDQITKTDFDFISKLVFNGAKMMPCNFLGLL